MNPDSLANAGFGLYGENGTGIVGSYDPLFGNYQLTGSRKNIFLIKQQYTQKINTQTEGYPATLYGQVRKGLEELFPSLVKNKQENDANAKYVHNIEYNELDNGNRLGVTFKVKP
jgi:hypothetical protein